MVNFIESLTIISTSFLLIVLTGIIIKILRELASNYTYWTFGTVGLYISSIIGTPIHEFGHLILAIIFACDIKQMKLIPRLKDFSDGNGKLGFVSYNYNRNSFYSKIGMFFIGIGPIFSGSITILLLMKILVLNVFDNILNTINLLITESNGLIDSFSILFTSVFKEFFNITNLQNPLFYLFIFLACNIASHMSLSGADIKGSSKGIIFLTIFSFIISIIVMIAPFGTNMLISMSTVYMYLVVILFISIIFSFLNFFVIFLLHSLIKRIS